MNSLYPSDFSQWIALIGALVPIFTLAVSGLFRAIAYRDEVKRKNWHRFYEISKILYNKDHENGQFGQYAALFELDNLNVDRTAKAKIAREALRVWGSSADPDFVRELDRIERRYSGGRISL